MSGGTLSLRHLLLAIAVMAVWGSNFVVIHIGLEHLPPLTFAALRFAFAFFPACLFIKRPNVAWRSLAAYGLLIGVGQFGLLFIAMNGQITPALASLVVQMQVFFTIALAALLSGERVRPFQFLALAIAVAGLALIVMHTDAQTTTFGLALVLVAALSWAGSNIVIRSSPNVDMLSFVVWASPFCVVPLVAAALMREGWPAIVAGIGGADATTWAAVLWQSFGNTLFGYAVWGLLLARYPVAVIAPMSLLVPVFGIAASAMWLGEPMQAWKLEATVLVLLGLFINVMWPKFAIALQAREQRDA
ncbi:MAG: EamA family transporter [Hyphomicrobium sp.]|jgi:O-acetylserine/cysteine efflux transporter